MNRRAFFRTAAGFVAGCALGLGLQKEILKESVNEVLYRHQYESQLFYFFPNFQDFLEADEEIIKHLKEKKAYVGISPEVRTLTKSKIKELFKV